MKFIDTGHVELVEGQHPLDFPGDIDVYTVKVTGVGHSLIPQYYENENFDASNVSGADEAWRVADWLSENLNDMVLWTERSRYTIIEFLGQDDHEAFVAWARVS